VAVLLFMKDIYNTCPGTIVLVVSYRKWALVAVSDVFSSSVTIVYN